jgi:hypothetical protein
LVIVAKAIEEDAFLDASTEQKQQKDRPAGDEEDGVGTHQCDRRDKQRGANIKRVSDESVRTYRYKSVLLPRDNSICQVLAQAR